MHPERVVRGEAHPGAKLTEDAVRSIRQRYALGNITQRLLAIEYGVSDMLIRNVIRRKAWAHVE
jgi:DNA-binding GntR family transcriptional regulator